jgi:uncharacterized protein YjeT (DUF2065 family)
VSCLPQILQCLRTLLRVFDMRLRAAPAETVELNIGNRGRLGATETDFSYWWLQIETLAVCYQIQYALRAVPRGGGPNATTLAARREDNRRIAEAHLSKHLPLVSERPAPALMADDILAAAFRRWEEALGKEGVDGIRTWVLMQQASAASGLAQIPLMAMAHRLLPALKNKKVEGQTKSTPAKVALVMDTLMWLKAFTLYLALDLVDVDEPEAPMQDPEAARENLKKVEDMAKDFSRSIGLAAPVAQATVVRWRIDRGGADGWALRDIEEALLRPAIQVNEDQELYRQVGAVPVTILCCMITKLYVL